jgi:hypothetical protein
MRNSIQKMKDLKTLDEHLSKLEFEKTLVKEEKIRAFKMQLSEKKKPIEKEKEEPKAKEVKKPEPKPEDVMHSKEFEGKMYIDLKGLVSFLKKEKGKKENKEIGDKAFDLVIKTLEEIK